VERLSRHLGPTGLVAPFSLADLRSYALRVSARARGDCLVVRPVLADAQQRVLPLYGLDLQVQLGEQLQEFEPEWAADGAPTGDYAVRVRGVMPPSVKVLGRVRLATPSGMRDAAVDRTVPVERAAPPERRQPPRLDLIGWGYPAYELSTAASHGPESMRRLVSDARAAGVTKLMIHARTSTETLYPSRIAARTGVSEWDVLAAAVAEGRRQGVAIYAAHVLGIAQEADLRAHSDWAMLDRHGKPTGWYCYTHPEVRAFHAALLSEVVARYPVAGVSVDFCRPGGGCFCRRCAAAFAAQHGRPLANVLDRDPAWLAWQRDQITSYMRELRQAVRRARDDAVFSGYVLARFAPDADRAGQDWPRWLREGIMDFVATGAYTPSTPWFRAQCHTLRELAERELGGDTSRIYPLLGPSYIELACPPYADSDAVIARHLQATGEEGMRGAGFFPFYAVRTHMETAASAARNSR
jgi:hypothetical protein